MCACAFVCVWWVGTRGCFVRVCGEGGVSERRRLSICWHLDNLSNLWLCMCVGGVLDRDRATVCVCTMCTVRPCAFLHGVGTLQCRHLLGLLQFYLVSSLGGGLFCQLDTFPACSLLPSLSSAQTSNETLSFFLFLSVSHSPFARFLSLQSHSIRPQSQLW